MFKKVFMTYIVHLFVMLFFLICTLELSFAQGDLSATLQGQAVATKLTVGTIQVPNNLATKTGSINALIETGNQNLLVNPSFEHSSYLTGWTSSGTGSNAQDTTSEIHGLKAVAITTSSQTIDLSQTSTLYASQFADGVQGLASIRVKTNHTGTCSVCSVQNSTVSTTNCVTVQANNKWGLYKVPFILGATNNGISLACTSGTGTTYVDDAFVGAVDLQASVDQSRIAGESYFAGTASCTWSRTSTTVGAFTATAACPGPTIVVQNMGQWQTTDSDLPRQTINNLPAGTYKAKFYLNMSTSGGNVAAISINDGTTTCEAVQSNNSNTTDVGQVVECTFTYTSSGNRTFEVYGASSAGSLAITNSRNASPRISTKFILEYFGSGSVYTSTNADTDWASFTPTGSWSANTTYSGRYRFKGSMLEIQYYWITSGAPTSAGLSLNLPSGFTIDTSKLANATIGNVISRDGVLNDSGTNFYTASALYKDTTSVFVNSENASATYATVNNNVTQAVPFTWASGDFGTLNLSVPVVGRSDSNIIIGQFNEVMVTPNVTKPKTCYYAFGGTSSTLTGPTICTASPCVEIYDSCGAFPAPTRGGTGSYTSTSNSGLFANSTFVHCKMHCGSPGGFRNCNNATSGTNFMASDSNGALSIRVDATNQTGTPSDSYVSIECTGAAP